MTFINIQFSKNHFFRIKETNFYKVISYNKINIYANNNDMCWATPTPCTYNPNLIVKEKYGFYIVKRKKKLKIFNE